ncbi:MAG TPA: family 16 glycosylhydrolase [Acidimicrobiales bacterium]
MVAPTTGPVVGASGASEASRAAPLSPPEGTIPDLAALGWEPVFEEEFEGTTLDESLWTKLVDDDWIDDGIQTPDTIALDGQGHLQMSVYTDENGREHGGGLMTGGIGSMEPTAGGYDSAYGYAEARMRFPDGPATISTFWMMSANGNNSLPFGDPASDGPELDIAEHYNLPTSGPLAGDSNGDGRCDWPGDSPLPCTEAILVGGHWDGFEEDHKSFHFEPTFNPNPEVSLQGVFHTYGVLWTPDEYRFFIDGVQVERYTIGQTFAPEYILLQTYIAYSGLSDFGPLGSPDNDITLVDYVKVWQRPISDVPDQATAVDTPLAVPFTVQDYHYESPDRPEPGTVIVTAESSNPDVVPNTPEHLAVTGNGPADPDGDGPLEATDGSFDDGSFEGSGRWAIEGWATTTDLLRHSGQRSLYLSQLGGRATQRITGLRPNTTYLVGARYELHLDHHDLNGNGRVDAGEPFLPQQPVDGEARFDFGVRDVDASRPGDQEVRLRPSRNGWSEMVQPAWWGRQRWPHEYLKFTTGPDTTAVDLFFDNTAYVGTSLDSDVAIDSVHVRPLVPPLRTLTVLPAEGRVGDTTITLTARAADGSVMGTDEFRLTVGAGSLRDGTFEAGERSTPWALTPNAEIEVPDPFQVDRRLRLGATTHDAAAQTITGLAPSTRYRLEITGAVDQAGGELMTYLNGYGGPQGLARIDSTTPGTAGIEFVTGPSSTSAEVVIVDWDAADGGSTVDRVVLTRCATQESCRERAPDAPAGPLPALADVGLRRGPSDDPLTVAALLPEGATITSVTSTNPALVPDDAVVAVGSGRRWAFTATPVPDRTGRAAIRVAYEGAPGSPVDVPLVVSDDHLRQPGFEAAGRGWSTSGSATFTTRYPHSGARALELNGPGEALQTMRDMPHGTTYRLDAWVDGTATITLRTIPVDLGESPDVLASTTLTGNGWTEHRTEFTTMQCSKCPIKRWRPVELVITDGDPNDGVPVRVDDLVLIQPPVTRVIRDVSLHEGQTTWGGPGRRDVSVGRVTANDLWDPDVVSVTTSDIPGFGTGVVPVENVRGPELAEHAWPYGWQLDARAGGKTGRSNVHFTLRDRGTGQEVTRTYAVTVNAGNNFDNGDFQRSEVGPVSGGWQRAWFNDSHEITLKQGHQYLSVRSIFWPYAGPRDDNRVLRLSSGAVKHAITGLTPNTEYRVRLRAKGNGATVGIRSHDDLLGSTTLGQVAIAPPNTDNVWRDYTFTFRTTAGGEGSTSVVLLIQDDNMTGPAEPATARACAVFAAGETCYDDIGIFKVADVG